MATVYLAEDRVLHREVALKSLHPHLLSQPESISRFSNEAHAIAQLDHENVIKIYDYGENAEKRYLIMEYIDGVSLLELLEQHERLPNLVYLEVLCQVLDGLAEVHAHNILHRDIKPANIMIGHDGRVRIMDFGIAYLVNRESITLTGSFVGSPSYISPEQATCGEISDKSDMFSIGTLSYIASTGLHPFEADNPQAAIHRVVHSRPDAPYSVESSMLLWFSELIEMCLHKDASGRPSASELREQITLQCDRDGLALDKSRIVRFLKNCREYREQERKEITRAYKQRAYALVETGKTAQAIRMLDQAARFGSLDGTDKVIIRRAGRKRKTMAAAIGVLVAVLLLLSTSQLVSFLRRSATAGEKTRQSAAGKQLLSNASSRQQDTLVVIDTPKQGEMVEEPSSTDSASQKIEPVVKTENVKRDSPEAVKQKNISSKKTAGQKATIPSLTRKSTEKEKRSLSETVEDTEEDSQTPGYGYIDIRTNPPWADLMIDDIQRGRTPRVRFIPLVAGEHFLRIQKNGYRDHLDTLTVAASDTLRLRLRLQSNSLKVSGN